MKIVDYLLDYLIEKTSPETILAFELPEEIQQREAFLNEKRQQQVLEADEAEELAEFLEAGSLVAALQARALKHQELVENFKRSWREVKEGKTYPISQLWDELEEMTTL